MLGLSIRDTVAGLLLGTWALALTGQGAHPAAPKRPAFLDQAHAQAVESFHHGRFSEAYGRFIALARWGRP